MKKDKTKSYKIQEFVETWTNPDRGGEKQDSQIFWISLLRDVFDIENPATFIKFEEKVKLDNASFIDAYIPTTKVLIEQKSRGKDLNKAIRQSDDTLLTPYQQAKRYSSELPLSEHPRWIVLSNFDQWHIYDMERPQGDPEVVYLKDFDKDYYRLNFLVDDHQNEILQREMEISVKAGEIVGQLYDALLKEYKNPKDTETLKSLNELIVRLVFCLYAEDAGIFDNHLQFHDYMKDRRNPRGALIDLFTILDTPDDKRDLYLAEDLLAFPYVNGGLFANHGTEIPRLNDEIMEIILHEASEDFNWSEISPTIFGAVFESTLNPETRRSGGMHYTSIENIHRVIDPLFLTDLKNEFNEIKDLSNKTARTKKLKSFQKKIADLKFLDPACGSGNFLTETYLSLRKLENEVLKLLLGDQIRIGLGEEYDPIQVNLSQFYGIEINDFAVSVARTALWIAEHQMMRKTEEIIHSDLDFLPLKTYTNIHEGNALTLNWSSIVSADELNYIVGNPPFVGASMMTKEQKKQAVDIYGKIKLSNSIDYVGAWYYKASELMVGTEIKAAFVSTNSITQGEQVAPLWDTLINKRNLQILFAYRTFKWNSEAKDKAAVHCVIIGFTCNTLCLQNNKFIYDNNSIKKADNISPYILDAPNVLVSSRSKPICRVPKMKLGNKPADGGNLILSLDDKNELIEEYPELVPYIHPYIGAEEYINKKTRYCLWLVDAPISILRNKRVRERLLKVKEMRLKSSALPTRLKADMPEQFFFISQPNTEYILVPSTSSESRKYIPMGFVDPDIIASNAATIIPDASIYHFGVLTSNVHMAWMRTVAGRLKSDYRYSGSVVYNNFPWPSPTDQQKKIIEKKAQKILEARALYPDSSLADLYDDLTMPSELRKAHQENDAAVMNAYGFAWKGEDRMSESDCVAALMKMYQELIDKENKK